MLGAIVGDIVGSIYEGQVLRRRDFPLFGPGCRFTDDTVLTVAIADALLHQSPFAITLKQYYQRYPNAGFGASFCHWGQSDTLEPYGSWGNGAAMRVSPVAFAQDTLAAVLETAAATAAVTHNHPEGIKGAQATAAAVFLARMGEPKATLRSTLERRFGYDLSHAVDSLTPADISCQDTVPKAIMAFLQAPDFETTLRHAIYIGGDSDTLACIAGAIAAAYYGIPAAIAETAIDYLDSPLAAIVHRFMATYGLGPSLPKDGFPGANQSL